MSNINPSIGNFEVIPHVETRAFDEHPDSLFALGIIAVGEKPMPGLEDVMRGYRALRWNVYGPQTNMIGEDRLDHDGAEKLDEDDPRSVHFGILENHLTGPRIVSCIRRILKSEEDPRPLPIEEFFPEVFEDNPAPLNSTEGSRFIARHENPSLQRTLSQPLLAGYAAHALTRGMGPTFGVVEPKVAADLLTKGVPFKQIAGPKFVPEYNADNLGIEIDGPLFGQQIEERAPGTLAYMNMKQTEGGLIYFGQVRHAEAVKQHVA